MLKYDTYRTNLLPEWATLADMFGMIREAAVGDKDDLGVRYEEEAVDEVLGVRG